MYVIAKVRLVKPVRAINTKTGTPMSASFGFADIGGEKGFPVGVVGFNNLANELSKYGQGTTIRASGTLQENGYTDKNGDQVDGYQIVLEGVAGVKSARGVIMQSRKTMRAQNRILTKAAVFNTMTSPIFKITRNDHRAEGGL